MSYTLVPDERERFLRDFATPLSWQAYLADEELRRSWPVLFEGPGQTLLRHGSGAVASLRLQGDRVYEAKLVEGAEARALLGRHGFRPGAEIRARVDRALTRGRPVDEALNAAFPRRLGVQELRGGPPGSRLYRVSDQGVLELQVDEAGALRSFTWRVGAQALDALDAHDAEAMWAVPAFPQADLPVRTPAEAALFLRVQRGEELARRREGARLRILARTPEGRRVFTFLPGREGGDNDLGEGCSPVLDPVELMLFAANVREKGGDPALLTLAAAAARQAARFVPPGASAPPVEALHTAAARLVLSRQPERLSPAALEALAEELEAMARGPVAVSDVPLAELVPVLLAAGAGDAEALRKLAPRPGDAARAFRAAAAAKVEAALGDEGPPPMPAGAGRTAIRVHPAPVEALAAGAPEARAFPGAYATLAREYLQPGRLWVAWEFHAPGQDLGVRYDGLVWVDDHWAWFPKPWRALS